MIKNLLVLSVLLVVSAGVKAERTYEYKCWLTMSDGSEMIAMVRLDTKGNHGQARAKLARSKVVETAEGARDFKKVHECVELYKPFTSSKAQSLDQRSVR
ncbi:hypothetical protein GCM10011369_10800 [Neiella marina]|uniref:Uncharacterized protein n=1 Tax=Neiella marina TaxID=508461 RepID=A0A8J2U3M6_9GAMM|nr:TapY2 family type IVa secretion system protein [Neiella marina]GGA70948.1 hypothetical protein GCM10011369_10800 [Neiella marina]